MPYLSRFVFLIAAAALSACEGTDVRVLNAIPGATTMNVTVNDDALPSVPFENITSFGRVEPKQSSFSSSFDFVVETTIDGNRTTSGSVDPGLASDRRYFVTVAGSTADLALIALEAIDSATPVQLRFMHAYSSNSKRAVTATLQGISDQGESESIGSVAFGGISNPVELTAGTYTLQITDNGNLVLDTNQFTLGNPDDVVAVLISECENSTKSSLLIVRYANDNANLIEPASVTCP